MLIESRSYRYVQSVTTITEQGVMAQLIGTTDSEDRTQGLDDLILRHRMQMGAVQVRVMSIVFMSADGTMSMMDGNN